MARERESAGETAREGRRPRGRPSAASSPARAASAAAARSTSTTATWISVLGTLAVVATLALAREFLVPIALAALLTFVMSPPVAWLERRIGRVPAVLGAVAVVFALLVGAGWVLLRQLDGVAKELPRYRTTLVTRLAQLQTASRGGTVGELQKTIDTVQHDLGRAADKSRASRVVVAEPAVDHSPFGMLGPVMGLAASAGLVVALVIFMLLERRDLRDRIVELAGRGHVALATRALDEAGSRVARQLLMQMLVNAIYGLVAGLGLWWLDVPYPVVWGALGAVLRLVPYVGPLIGAAAPILIAVAASDGWRNPVQVAALMLALELFTNLVLETVLYAGAAGVSQVGLLVAATFWTWLWGPVGLVMAIPLTVCLVVIGKHVRGLEYLATLMSDTPALSPSHAFYQRLLARDLGEASDLVGAHVAAHPPRSVYDALIVPALTYAEMDRLEGKIDADAQAALVTAAREMMADAARRIREADAGVPTAPPEPTTRMLGYGMNDRLDDLALDAFTRMVDDLPVAIDCRSTLLASEVPEWAVEQAIDVVCIADLPPSPAARSRQLVRRLRRRSADLVIVVGRWGSQPGDDDAASLLDAGASHVGVTLDETRAFLCDRVLPRPAPAASSVQDAPWPGELLAGAAPPLEP
ncbi:MAG: AI-2E family transporter [Vicinamibacterales bacterium]